MVFSMDACMCMLQTNNSQPQSRENMTPQVEELGFEDFDRTNVNSKSYVIGFNDENHESTKIDSNYVTEEGSSSLNNIISYINMEERVFCVPAVIRTRKDVAQADTGSDIVVISYGLIKYLNLPMKLLSENGFSGLTMNVANGTSSPLKYFTSFQINVLGISRHVEAFLRPCNSSNEQEFHLLLGLPWLHDTNAKIYIRDSIIKIGDPDRSEKMVQIQGPEFTQSSYHKLILHPKKPGNRDPRSNCSESSSDNGDDSESDFDSDIYLDENLFEDNKLSQESKKNYIISPTTFDQLSPPFIDSSFSDSPTSAPRLTSIFKQNLSQVKLKSYLTSIDWGVFKEVSI
ncbi:hypothetical protein OnM2_086053 [Erysiphe neolycopersici]|uniref:Uncharacterized protein n=1 Tax=Erysiphe neolycopersici TaxID=212602 RepID=A0A420HEB6_9PEZI|nr:hypothetical protein OnM2_086053 [Erysiphe neolycopersici]